MREPATLTAEAERLARRLHTPEPYKHPLQIVAEMMGDEADRVIVLGQGDYPTFRNVADETRRLQDEAAAMIRALANPEPAVASGPATWPHIPTDTLVRQSRAAADSFDNGPTSSFIGDSIRALCDRLSAPPEGTAPASPDAEGWTMTDDGRGGTFGNGPVEHDGPAPIEAYETDGPMSCPRCGLLPDLYGEPTGEPHSEVSALIICPGVLPSGNECGFHAYTLDDWNLRAASPDAGEVARAAALDRLPALLRRIDVSRALYDHERKTMPAWELKALEDWARALAALTPEREETDRG